MTLISKAQEDVIVRCFETWLKFGSGEWGYGNDPQFYARQKEIYLEHSKQAARAGRLTFADLLLGQLYCVLASDGPGELRHQLVAMAAEVIDWIEAIDRKAGVDEPAP